MLTSLAHPVRVAATLANEASKTAETFRIAQLSDPHLTSLEGVSWRSLANKRLLGYLSWRKRRRFDHDRQVLAAVVAHLRARAFDHVAVTGDLTHVGLPEECRAAAEWLAALGDPRDVTVVPGNHDRYVAADRVATVGRWSRYLAGDDGTSESPPSLRVRGGVALIGVDSAVPSPPAFATGRTGVAQRGRLAGMLAEARSRGLFRLVLIHHSPLPDGHGWRKRLTDATEVMAVLRREGAELVIHGHGHRRRTDLVTAPAGRILIVAAPSASLAGRGAGGYNGYTVAGAAGSWTVRVDEYAADGSDVRALRGTDYRLNRP